MVYVTGAIVGNTLAPSPILATLPISIFVVGMAACVSPAGEVARRYGRRISFLYGTSAGVLTGLFAMAALFTGWFWLFCLSTFFGGAYAAVVLSFRFAATDGLSYALNSRRHSIIQVKTDNDNRHYLTGGLQHVTFPASLA